MVKPPSPTEADHLSARVGRLRADRLRHRIGHRAVGERADHAPPSVHFKVARSPDGAGADVEGEHGIIRGVLAEQAGQVLRMDRLAARRAGSEFVESVTRLR